LAAVNRNDNSVTGSTPVQRERMPSDLPFSEQVRQQRPTLRDALPVWLRIGLLSFGGPAGQIALMHDELVERRRWVDESGFLHGLNFCMLLPGPEAMQLACYLGWRLHGTAGGLLAGILFILPGALLMLLLGWLFVTVGQLPQVAGVLLGVQAAVLGIVAHALARSAGKMLKTPAAALIALAALLALAVLKLPFPVLILCAALIGALLMRWRPGWLPRLHAAPRVSAGTDSSGRIGASLRVAAVALLAWWAPLLLVALTLGVGSTAWAMGMFFSQAALVTFGGAYAVLPYVAQRAVETHAWLDAGQMLVGLGLAESTPGPLILVLQFVGFVGGWQHPDLASPLGSSLLCAAIALWATFLPSFLFILSAAPWIERMRELPWLVGALAGVSAAVVGVIANLAIWFGWQLLGAAERDAALLIAALAMASWLALRRERVPLPAVVLLAAGIGAAASAQGWIG
jgi:chromate transporter